VKKERRKKNRNRKTDRQEDRKKLGFQRWTNRKREWMREEDDFGVEWIGGGLAEGEEHQRS